MTTVIPGMSGLQLAAATLKSRAQTSAGAMPSGAAKDKILAIIPLADQASALIMEAFNTGTAPPPAPSTVQAELIKSVDNTPHEGCIANTNGWDWEHHGVIQAASPGTRRGASGWISFQEDCHGNSGGLAIETRNFAVWIFAGGAWQKIISTLNDSQIHPTPPHEGGVIGSMGPGPNFAMPRHGVGSQAYSWQASIPSNTQGMITVMEVRLPAGAPANTNLLVCTGSDYWPFAGSTGGNGGAAVGRFRRPTSAWQWVAASSLPVSVLTSTPPPL